MEQQAGSITVLETGFTYRLPLTPSACYPRELGQGRYDVFDAGEDFILCSSEADLTTRAHLVPRIPPPLDGTVVLGFFCSLIGSLEVRPEGFRKLSVQSGQIALARVSGTKASFILPPTRQHWLSGGFTISFLQAVTQGMQLPRVLLRMIESCETDPLLRPGRIDGRYRLLLYDLLNCPWKGAAAQLYHQAKGLEFLAYLTEALNGHRLKHSHRWRRADVDRLHAARGHLLADLQTPPTLLELSRHVGLCPTKLKRGFREVLDSTVTGTLRAARLQQARHLLENTDLSLQSIADKVGYSDAASLSHAFRAHFGIPPGRLRTAAYE